MATTIRKAAKRRRAPKRSAARQTMLEAARSLAGQKGVVDLTLVAVAEEAGFAPATVYGQFRNKDELLLAIVAEDLAILASTMRGIFPDEPEPPAGDLAESGDEEQSQAHVSATPVSAEPPNPKRRVLSLVKDEHIEAESAETAASPAAESADRPRVDAWLERRLRVFEHTLAQLDRRLNDVERGTARAVDLSEEGIKNLVTRIDGFESRQTETVQVFGRRLEDAERRQQGTAAELRAATNDTSARLEALESRARSVEPQFHAEPEPAPLLHEPQAMASDEKPEPQEAPAVVPGQDDYLAAARRAASAAALLADMESRRAKRDGFGWHSLSAAKFRLNRKHFLIVACAAIVAFVAGAFVAFYVGEAQGRSLTVAALPSAPDAASVKALPVRHPSPATHPESALDRLSALANSGNAKAELLIGLKYLHGDGTAINDPEAAKWIRRAADQHEPMAQYSLAELYERGDGVAADAAEAIRWYEAAAGQGNRKAMHALGLAYAEGRGTDKDMSQAARWFAKAAEFGLVNSQFNLGVLYERGQGVPQSLLNAYKWYAVAAAQGDLESKSRVEVLKTQLNPEDVAAAGRAAQSFQPQSTDPGANATPTMAELASNAVR